MENIESILKLENQLEKMVQEKFNALETMTLIPEELDSDTFCDWLWECPILHKEDKYGNINFFYIVDIIKGHTELKFIGRNTQDYTDAEEFYPDAFTLDKKIKLLKCVQDIKQLQN